MPYLVRVIGICLCVGIVSACSVGRDYQKPNIALPTAYRNSLPDQNLTPKVSEFWWQQFSDPTLSTLIDLALKNNKDLVIATANIEEFYALYGVARSAYFPTLDLGGKVAKQQDPFTVFSSGNTQTIYTGTLNLAWELDVWGRIRRSTEAARADLLSQEANRRAVVLTLVSSVARAYVELRELDRRLEISKRTLKTRQESLKLAQVRFKGGATSELDLRQAESEVAATKVFIPGIERQIAQKENQLSVLLGRNPGEIPRGRTVDELSLHTAIPGDLPSALLQNRPDIVKAEQNLISANARIGVAKAAYFPRFSLTGLFGYASTDLGDFIQRSSRRWNFGPDFVAPIFNAGKIDSDVEAARARERAALASYERSILVAMGEVEDSLIGLQKRGEVKKETEKQVSVLKRYLDLAQLRYNGGQSSYLEVLDAQRNLFSADLKLAEVQSYQALSVIELYRAMGGSWVTAADQPVQK